MKRSRKQRVDAAIAYALDRRWDLAAAENQSLLEEFPDDLEAANRLGKALTELGDVDGATAAYQRSLTLDATNVIARRNLTRLQEMRGSQSKRRPAKRGTPAAASAPGETVRPHSLIEESGKSAEFELLDADAQALGRVSAGEPAELVPTTRGISVRSTSGAVLGHIETRAGLRLRRLIEGGNRYAAVIRRVNDGDGSIYVRETYRDPSLVDQPSFLPPATSARRRLTPRAYTKASIVRYQTDGLDDEVEDDDGDSGWTPRPRRGEDEEFERGGFSDTDADSDGDSDDDGALQDDEDDDDVIVGEDDEEPVVDEDE